MMDKSTVFKITLIMLAAVGTYYTSKQPTMLHSLQTLILKPVVVSANRSVQNVKSVSGEKVLLKSRYGVLHFADPPLPVTAQLSFPGSGTTWLRHLLQQATGIATSAIYAEYGDRDVFPAVKVTDGRVLVIKSHVSNIRIKNCSRAIILVRNPFKAIIAEFSRRKAGHTGVLQMKKFKTEAWESFSKWGPSDWFSTYSAWLQFPKPFLVVAYEDLKLNTRNEIRHILQFLKVPVSEDRLTSMMNTTEGLYHRKPRTLAFNPFKEEEVIQVKRYVAKINSELQLLHINVTVDDSEPEHT